MNSKMQQIPQRVINHQGLTSVRANKSYKGLIGSFPVGYT